MEKGKLKFIVITILLFFIVSTIASSIVLLFVEKTPFGNIALIPVKGIILVEGGQSFMGEQIASSTEIVAFIEQADKNPSIKAILFEINSPGGSAVASKEIVDAIKRINKTSYALIREVGASGGYWVASASDKIIANELSITGSIGVISSYLELSGLLNRYNITYQRLVSGKYKDMGTSFKPLEKDEEQILMQKLNKIHEYFIRSVAENRNIPVEEIKTLATGEFYLGLEAFENGLIDILGDKETAKELIKKDLNITEIEFAEYKTEKTLLDVLAGVFSENSFFVGKGIGSALKGSRIVNEIDITT